MGVAFRETWITGLGIVSCLGEGRERHWQRLNQAPPLPDNSLFAPYPIHRLGPLDFDSQITKKGDQRQMGAWQRIGTYAAGLALDSAGAKGDSDLLARMDMIVAAGGGERDETVDSTILSGLPTAERREAFINEQLMSDLRPTLFLTQLSNLLAGNISVVHGVTGSSRTLMGEEAAGVDAVRIALSRIQAGQSEIVLVGGACNCERRDLLLLCASGGYALKGGFASVWERQALGGGLALGSLGSFLVLEAREHAAARNAKPLARLTAVLSHRAKQDGATEMSLSKMWERVAPWTTPGRVAVISGATGVEPVTSGERAWIQNMSDIPVRATGTYIGHGFEPQFAMNIAIATLVLEGKKLFPPADFSGVERAMVKAPAQVVVTGVGHWRGVGMALVETVS